MHNGANFDLCVHMWTSLPSRGWICLGSLVPFATFLLVLPCVAPSGHHWWIFCHCTFGISRTLQKWNPAVGIPFIWLPNTLRFTHITAYSNSLFLWFLRSFPLCGNSIIHSLIHLLQDDCVVPSLRLFQCSCLNLVWSLYMDTCSSPVNS